MRRLLLIGLVPILMAPAAKADHIGIYSDATGSSCVLSAGMNSTATLIHKFATGATGIRFRVDFSTAPGSIYYGFNTAFTPAGLLNDDLTLGYAQCLTGSFVMGTMLAFLGSGQIHVRAANGADAIVYTSCSFDQVVASGGQASIGNTQCSATGTESATWGQIKSLYK